DAGQAFYRASQLDPGDPDRIKDLAEFIFRTNPVLTPDVRHMAEYCYAQLSKLSLEDTYRKAALLGDLAQRLEQPDAAARWYRQCLELRSNDEFATGRLAEVLISIGQNDAATELVDALPDNSKHKLLRSILHARILKAQGQTDSAILLLQDAEKYAGHEFVRRKCLVELTELLLETNQPELAMQTASHLLMNSGEADEARVWLIRAQAAAGIFEDAVSGLLKIQDSAGFLPSLVTEVSTAASRQGRDGDLDAIVDSVNGQSFQSLLRSLFATARLVSKGRVTEGQQVLARAVVMEPGEMVYWDYLRQLKQDSSDTPSSIDEHQERGVRTSLKNRAPDLNVDFDFELNAAEKVWREHPDDESSVRRVLTLLSWSDQARRDLVDPAIQIVNDHPADASAYHLLSIALRLSERYDDAILYEAAAYSLDQRPEFLIHAACTRCKAGWREEATESLKLCLRAVDDPEDLSIHDRRLLEQLQSTLLPTLEIASVHAASSSGFDRVNGEPISGEVPGSGAHGLNRTVNVD
ncbi:MAG: hypothetical protein KDA91_20015, partial [Planctomycetaceae bacterium]|nr:hypothetical protein [Planctomycetaceae bacterium]